MNRRIQKTWDDTICNNAEGVRWLTVDGIAFDALPAALSNLPKGVEVSFQHCSFKSFPDEAFAGTGKIKLRFQYCEAEFQDLKQHVLVNGSGRCEIEVFHEWSYERDKTWQTIHSLGLDFAGDAEMRQLGYEMRRGLTVLPPATRQHLKLMQWSRKPVRQQAIAFLEKHWPNPMPQAPAKAALYLMGKPVYSTLSELKEAIAHRGWTVVRTPAKADFAVLLDAPKDKLDKAGDLPVVLEKQLKVHLDAAAEPGLELTDAQTDNLAEMLLNPDTSVVQSALALLKSVELEPEVTTALVAAMMFHDDKDVRKKAKQHVLGHAPDRLVSRFQKDRRNYASLTDGKKLLKVAKEMDALGLDGATFSRHMVRLFMQQGGRSYLSDEVLTAALNWPENLPGIWAELAHMERVYLPRLKGTLWPGMDQLTSCQILRVTGGRHTKADHVADLATLPNLHTLEYWVRPARLDLLAPLAPVLQGLEFRGAVSELSDIGPLAAFTRLERLSMGNTSVTDLTPLSALPLTALNAQQLDVQDLSPLSGLTRLTWLDLEGCKATDYAPLASLASLESLTLSRSGVTALTPIAGLKALKFLRLSNLKLDLAPLAGMNLTRLEISRGTYTNLSVLEQLPALTEVTAYGLPPETMKALKAKRPKVRFYG